VQFIVQLTPLYHAVALERAVTLGLFDPSNVVDAVYLLVMGLVGVGIVAWRINRLLLR
jgi:lipooligosaccharide transport system permease protein